MLKSLKYYPLSIKQFLSQNRADIKYIALIIVTTLLFFLQVLLHPEQLISGPGIYGSDTVNYFYPLYDYVYSLIKEGNMPYWNSLILSGYPLIGNPQLALFYPLNVIFLFLSTATAFSFSYMIHVFLGGLFMYILAKHFGLERICAFLAAIIFMFGGFIIAHVYPGHYSMICAAVWLPLIFLLFDITLIKKSIKYAIITGLFLGVQLLAGHIQISYITIVGLSIYLAYKALINIKSKQYKEIIKSILFICVAILTGVFLSAIQFLPMYEYSLYSTRVGGLDFETATSYSLSINFFGFLLFNPWSGSYLTTENLWPYHFWEYSSYVGILSLILVIFAIYYLGKNSNVRFLFVLAVISILIGFGKYSPLYWLLYVILPGLDSFRVPARFILLLSFSLSLLAGFGFSYFRRKIDSINIKDINKILALLLLIAIMMIFFAIFTTVKFSPAWIALILLTLFIIIAVIIIYIRINNRISPKYFDICVVSVIIFKSFHTSLVVY